MVRERKITAPEPDDDSDLGALPETVPEFSLNSLRLSEFVGQQNIKERLYEIINKTKLRNQPLPHLILSGPSKSGRRTLATAIAREIGVKIDFPDASSIKSERELVPYLTNLEHGSVLAIIDAERLPKSVLRMIKSALEDFSIDIVLGEGLNARTLNLKLKHFTCIAITSRPDKTCDAIRRHSIQMEFDPYSIDEAVEIICRKSDAMNMNLRDGYTIQPELLKELVTSVHGSIDDAMNLLRKANAVCAGRITREAFRLIGHAFQAITLEESPSVRLQKMLQMSGQEFEQYIAEQFAKRGYAVIMTPTTGDHGIDIRLKRSGKDGIAQCKRWNESVGEKELRDFYGSMCHDDAAFGFFVTTSSFSANAISFAKGKNIALIDGDDLSNDPDWIV